MKVIYKTILQDGYAILKAKSNNKYVLTLCKPTGTGEMWKQVFYIDYNLLESVSFISNHGLKPRCIEAYEFIGAFRFLNSKTCYHNYTTDSLLALFGVYLDESVGVKKRYPIPKLVRFRPLIRK